MAATELSRCLILQGLFLGEPVVRRCPGAVGFMGPETTTGGDFVRKWIKNDKNQIRNRAPEKKPARVTDPEVRA